MSLPPRLEAGGHIHITEREPDGSWEDCTWCAGLEFYRIVYDLKTPATHAEMQALRKASGEPTTGGSDIGDLRRGIKARYGATAPPAISGFSALWSAMSGKVAVAQGSMRPFGPDNHYSRWDRDFDGGHAVFAYRPKDQDRVWWCDPLAPASYQGEWMSKANFQKYVQAFAGQHLVGPIRALEDIAMPQAPHTSELPRIIDIPAGTVLYDLDGKTPQRKLSTAVPGRFSPFAIDGGRAIYSGKQGERIVSIVRQFNNLRPVPDTTPYSLSDLSAAKAAGVAEERGRLRTLLSNLFGL